MTRAEFEVYIRLLAKIPIGMRIKAEKAMFKRQLENKRCITYAES